MHRQQADGDSEPSTIVNVRIVGDRSTTASSTGSVSAGRSFGQQNEGRICHRTGAVPQYQMPSPSHQLTSPSAMGQQSDRSPRAVEIPAAAIQLVNARMMRASSDRGSVLQKFNEELQQQQQMSWKLNRADNPLLYLHAPAQTDIVKPVPVKAQPPCMPGFRLLVSSPSQVPFTTFVPSSVQSVSDQSASSFLHSQTPGRKTETSSSFSLSKLSPPGSSQISDQLPLSCGSDARNPYISVGVSQFMQSGSPIASLHTSSRRHPDPGIESSYSPGRQSFSLASDMQQTPVYPACTVIPTQYTSPQHGISLPINYGLPMSPSLEPQSPQSLMPSHTVQSVNVVSPRHSSPQKHAAVWSPSMSHPLAVYSEGSYQQAVYSLSKQQPRFSALHSCSDMPVTAAVTATHRFASIHGPEVGLEVSSAASHPLPRSTLALRQFRIEAPATAVVPPVSAYPLKLKRSFSNLNVRGEQQLRQKQMSVLPPARAPRHISKDRGDMFPGVNVVGVDSFRLPPPEQKPQQNVHSTAAAYAPSLSSTTVSPGKFFAQGTMDFDSYIGRPIAIPQNQTTLKPEDTSKSSAAMEISKPNKKKQSSPLCSGAKRKLDLTKPPSTDAETESKTEHRFADKFQESLSNQHAFDSTEADKSPNKWLVIPASEKQSKV